MGKEYDNNHDDDLGHRQFEEDMRMDKEERMRMRAVPRGRPVWNGDDQGGMEQGQRGWNRNRGGMEQGQQGWNRNRGGMEQGQQGWDQNRGGMEQGQHLLDDTMRQEMNMNNFRRKQVADELEKEDLRKRWALIRIYAMTS